MSINFSKLSINSIPKNELQLNNNNAALSNIPSISDTIMISDNRLLKDFKDQVFGGYKLSQASQALDKAIIENKLEPALHWSIQLLLSGIVSPLWNKLICVASKNINICNPKLPEFLYNKTKQWHMIVDNPKYSKDNILQLRNNSQLRLLLAEMVSIITLSKKRKLSQLPRIKKEEFLIDRFKSQLDAKDNKFIETITVDGDPSEIKIAINELAYNLFHSNLTKALYWLSWIMEWEKINSKKYGKYECGYRVIECVDVKYYKDVAWFIWSVILYVRKLKFAVLNTDINRQCDALWNMYIDKFTSASRMKKQCLIIWTMSYITDSNTIDMSVPIIDKPNLLFQSLLGFDKIIMSLKSQEIHKTHISNSELLNVVVENNYMMPENYKNLEKSQLHSRLRTQNNTIIGKELQKGKKQIINSETNKKLNDIYNLDRMMYS